MKTASLIALLLLVACASSHKSIDPEFLTAQRSSVSAYYSDRVLGAPFRASFYDSTIAAIITQEATLDSLTIRTLHPVAVGLAKIRVEDSSGICTAKCLSACAQLLDIEFDNIRIGEEMKK